MKFRIFIFLGIVSVASNLALLLPYFLSQINSGSLLSLLNNITESGNAVFELKLFILLPLIAIVSGSILRKKFSGYKFDINSLGHILITFGALFLTITFLVGFGV